MTAKTLTVRLPIGLYEEGARLAKARRISVNGFIRECLENTIEETRKRALYDAFSEVGGTDSDVEYAYVAQREVLD